VVAADGIHSELRPYVFPPSKPVFHGTVSYRGLVGCERLLDWPMDRWQMWAGPSKHFLVFPVRHGALVNRVGFVPTDEEIEGVLVRTWDPAVLRREFEGWDPRIGDVPRKSTRHFAGALRP
jgi:salicylate hydroxylase